METVLLLLVALVLAAPSIVVAGPSVSDEDLTAALLDYVRARQHLLAPDTEPEGAIAHADEAFANLVTGERGGRDALASLFIESVSALGVAEATSDPAAAIVAVLSRRHEIPSALKSSVSAGYGALFQMVMEGRQPLRPRLALPEFLMAAGLPVTFKDLGLEGAEPATMSAIGAAAAELTSPQPYPTTAEDFTRVLIQLDNLGGKFGRQQDAAYIARKFLEQPSVRERVPAIEKLPALTVAFFGDSQTDNRHWSSPGHYPNILLECFAEIQPGITVVNAGIGGDNSGDGLARIEEDVVAHNPDICFIFFGGNDAAFYGRDHSTLTPDQFESNIARIIARFGQIGCRPVLVSYPPIPGFDEPDNEALSEMNLRLAGLRDSLQTGWLDVRALFAEHDPRRTYAVDLVHFSPEGHFLIADAVVDWLLSDAAGRQ